MATYNKNKVRSALRSKPALKDESSYDFLMKSADEAIVKCFNAFASDLRGASSNFTFHGDVTRARRIANTWSPQMYDFGMRSSEFDVPYVLSGFFDRYLSCQEVDAAPKLQAKAAKKFLGTNLDGVAIDQYVLNHEMLSPLLTRMKFHINSFFNVEFNPIDLYHLTGHGPNRTTDVEFESAYLHIKNRSIAGPKASLQQLLHYIHWDDQLRVAILEHGDDAMRSTINGFDLNGTESSYGTTANVVETSDTGFVSKKFDSLRTMCPEPTSVAFFAKMVALWITTRLSSYCHIDLRTQPEVHKMLARLGSLFPNLHIATVDWSEASDRIWLLLVEELMSEGYCGGWFSFMSNVCRCKSTNVKFKGEIGYPGDFPTLDDLEVFLQEHTDSYDLDVDKKYGKKYKVTCTVQTTMFATMGNPLTFPLQTLVFWAFLTACTEIYASENDMDPSELMDVSSFGDDGICDTRVIGNVKKYAEWLGWKLNLEKSFYEGAFRESCGGDFYQGRQVRPFEPKRPPLDDRLSDSDNKRRYQSWLYIVYNNLCIILERNNKDPHDLTAWLEQSHQVAKLGKICLVPPDYPDGSGVRIRNTLLELLPHFVSNASPSDWAYYRRWDVGPCFCALDEHIWPLYHNPSFTSDGKITFKCLSSRPRALKLEPEDSGHYYHDVLKRSSGDDDKAYTPTLSFFDLTVRGAARMDIDGNVAVKECRIKKTDATVAVWPHN